MTFLASTAALVCRQRTISTQMSSVWPPHRQFPNEEPRSAFRPWATDRRHPISADQLIAVARSGVERFFLPFSDFAPPETLQLFGTEVIPAVRSALA